MSDKYFAFSSAWNVDEQGQYDLLLGAGSYVVFLACRIQFNELYSTETDLTCESAAAFLQHVGLLLSHYPTDTDFKRRMFCSVESSTYVMLMFEHA